MRSNQAEAPAWEMGGRGEGGEAQDQWEARKGRRIGMNFELSTL